MMWIASPSAAAAASIIASDSVGCAWIVRRRSSTTAPISIASVASAIRSPAPLPTMWTPSSSPVLRVGDHLDEAVGVVDRQRAAERRERELADLELRVALGLRLVLGEAGGRDLRIGEHDRGDRADVERGLVAGDDLGDDLALLGRLVREHHAADQIADRVDAGDVGAQVIVGDDEAALVDGDARGLEAEVLAVRAAADRDQDLVGVDRRGLAVLRARR